MTEALMVKCHYRENGIVCSGGTLWDSVTMEPHLLEGTSVYCPACNGKGMIPTASGRAMLDFLGRFARPQLRDIVDELFEEREQHE